LINTSVMKFLDSFCADTSVVPRVIDKLLSDLKSISCPEDEINEIVLSMDEAVTNAIQETIKKKKISLDAGALINENDRNITIGYTINRDEFEATIIDHGKGLDIFDILSTVPDNTSESYRDEIINYATESEKSKIKVRVNGREIPLRGIGAGLKIILRFMDDVSIDLIDREKVIASSVSEFTDGTIFKMKRRRRF